MSVIHQQNTIYPLKKKKNQWISQNKDYKSFVYKYILKDI